ncbi:MAG: hypothetical protein LKF13_05240 [Atopobiaceae bacterium]|nr:hypothetical protein [Atopobiaceae bacterium]
MRTAWGDVFGLDREQATVGRLVAALRPMGFDYILNTDFSADLTIMEEGTELLHRLPELAQAGLAPCSRAAARLGALHFKRPYPMARGQVSTAKCPRGMFGAVVKSYYAEMLGIEKTRTRSSRSLSCPASRRRRRSPSDMNDAAAIPSGLRRSRCARWTA